MAPSIKQIGLPSHISPRQPFQVPTEIMQLLGFLIGALAAAAQATSTSNVTKFTSFAQNLGLSAANTRALAARYAKADDSVAILNVACLTAQGVLGAANVDTSPLNQTIVDVNW